MTIHSSKSKRGVLLILILSLLAMFGLVAMTFVLVSGHALRSARANQRVGQYAENPREDLYNGFMAVVAGGGKIGHHSLLEDLYGNNTTSPFTITSASGNGALITIQTPLPEAELQRRGGCVLTILSGPAAGVSTHIVGVSGSYVLVRAFDNLDIYYADKLAGGTGTGNINSILSNSLAIINGAPFSGSGVGQTLARSPGTLAAAEMANEDYDAVDLENMMLAASFDTSPAGSTPSGLGAFACPSQASQPMLGVISLYSSGSSYQPNITTIPSLHRPALVSYAMTQDGKTAWQDLDEARVRKTILRPTYKHHPRFNGGNPQFNPILGPWDVDNNGDGVPDSVWVDAGLGVTSSSDGKLYKPLVAIYCVDMGGRVNLNAHGTPLQRFDGYYQVATVGSDQPVGSAAAAAGLGTAPFGGGMRGMGWGPAEINLRPIFEASPGDAPTMYTQLMTGVGTFDGRYGSDGQPGTNLADPLSYNLELDFGPYNASDNYWGFVSGTGAQNNYGSPADVEGNSSVALDVSGRPIYLGAGFLGGSARSQRENDPYEIELGGTASNDRPFTPEEFSRLLRPFDRDAVGLPDRLVRVTQDGATGLSALHRLRSSVTTESWSIPCTPESVAAMLQGKGATASTMQSYLVAPELLGGRKMDLNRMFGDGYDSDGDGVVDEPDEGGSDQVYIHAVTSLNAQTASPTTVPVDHLNDGSPGGVAKAMLAREQYARHLYCLAKLLIDTQALIDAGLCDDVSEANELLAQWAVNVVDFRDRDNIMTRFRYDPNPFDGWTPTATVWGCERPELLLFETLAFHDRRTEDLEAHGWLHTENAPEADPNADPPVEEPTMEYEDPADPGNYGGDGVPDTDQRYRPKGSLFVELYNPWTASQPKSLDLYDTVDGGVALSKVSAGGNGSPVWRLAIADVRDDYDPGTDEELPIPGLADAGGTTPGLVIERVVYFAPSGTGTVPPVSAQDGLITYFPSQARDVIVQPGKYAIVGPGESQGAGVTTRTNIGLLSGVAHDPNASTLRHIELDSSARGAFPVVNNTMSRPNSSDIAEQAWVAIDEAYTSTGSEFVRLSVTEPFTGDGEGDAPYAILANTIVPGQTTATNTYNPSTEQFQQTCDMPLDRLRFGSGSDVPTEYANLFGVNTTVAGYRVIYLQRLADPTRAYDGNPGNDTYNPYITVDAMPVDLTTFNGAEDVGETQGMVDGDSYNDVEFASRLRGEAEAALNADANVANVWKAEPYVRPAAWAVPAGGTAGGQHVMAEPMSESFGYLNVSCFGAPTSTGGLYLGDPQRKIPWLTWLNRPFVSAMELALVPTSSPSQLLATPQQGGAGTIRKNYQYVRTSDTFDDYTESPIEKGYPHLLSFLNASGGEGIDASKILDFVDVPSRYVAAYAQPNPADVASTVGHGFHPPNQRISLYREPGKINLNTIFDQNVYKCLMNNFPHSHKVSGAGTDTTVDAQWERFVWSRRGYGAQTDSMLHRNDQVPTEFARPFRTRDGAEQVYTLGNVAPPTRKIDSTILRADPIDNTRPLFGYRSSLDFNNTNRNPYFRYEGLRRIQNLVTTQSNVYGIWVTVGYFEVSPITQAEATAMGVDAAEFEETYPDGYQLGAELGSQTGDIRRHRAFFLFDRSIPVGFQRGNGLNADRAILTKQYIE